MPTALDHAEVAQLASQYAVAVDARDIERLIRLFSDEVDAGRHGRGRDALRAYFDAVLRSYRASIHFVTTQTIEFVDEDTAKGIVYCRADHQSLDDPPRWFVESVVFFDTYVRRAGGWVFLDRDRRGIWQDIIGASRSRSFVREPWDDRGSDKRRLPEAWPTWSSFWASNP